MTSKQYHELAQAVLWVRDWPRNMEGMVIRLVDFTGEASFRYLAGDQGYPTLTAYRCVQDRVAVQIRKRGGRVRWYRANMMEYEAWRERLHFKNTRRVRELYLMNYAEFRGASSMPEYSFCGPVK